MPVRIQTGKRAVFLYVGNPEGQILLCYRVKFSFFLQIALTFFRYDSNP